MSDPPATLLDRAIAHQQAKKFSDAQALFNNILANHPDSAEALYIRATTDAARNDMSAAIAAMNKAIALRPGYCVFLGLLGELQRRAGNLQDSLASCQQAIQESPNSALLHTFHEGLGLTLWQLSDFPQAEDAFIKAAELRPHDPAILCNLASVQALRGNLDRAIATFEQAAALDSRNPAILENLGTALFSKGRYTDAILRYRQAVELNPISGPTHNKFATALAAASRIDEAIDAYQKALILQPGLTPAALSLGALLRDTGRLDESIAVFRASLATRPDPYVASGMLYSMLFHPGYGPAELYQEHAHWNDAYASPLARSQRLYEIDRTPGRHLRVGYVSPDLRHHVVGFNLLPLLREHDHNQFEIFCYSHARNPDLLTERFRSFADQWRDIRDLNDNAAAELIRNDRIDILIDTSLHMAEHRLQLFALKPAPLQATFAGYPGTTGLRAIDYRLTDPYLDPPGQADAGRYSECSVRLPESFWCYDSQGEDVTPGDPPFARNGFITFGCVNTFAKITQPMVERWAQIVVAHAGSHLLLLAPPGSSRQRLLSILGTKGVDPGRVEFCDRQPRLRYFEQYRRIDVYLDTFPYNGHSTLLDALWMGVPPVTLRGQQVVSRGGYSILSNLGLADLTAETPEQYLQIALQLSNDPSRLANFRLTLRDRMRQSVLMDAPRFARGVEAAFRTMWQGVNDEAARPSAK